MVIDGALYDLLIEAVRVLFLLLAPPIFALTLAGLVVGSIQTMTAISDAAVSYAAKLFVLLVVGYFFMPSAISALQSLCELALR